MSLFVQFLMGPCFYCGCPTYKLGPQNNHPQKYTRDHLVPNKLRAPVQRYPDTICHLITVTACLNCNQRKGSKKALEFLERHGIATKEKRRQINRVYAFNANAWKMAENRAKSLARELQ